MREGEGGRGSSTSLFLSPLIHSTASLSLSPSSETVKIPTVDGFRPLDEKSLVKYIKATPSLSSHLIDGYNHLDGGKLQIKEVGDGNLNFVFNVVAPSGSLVIKQSNYSLMASKDKKPCEIDQWRSLQSRFLLRLQRPSGVLHRQREKAVLGNGQSPS